MSLFYKSHFITERRYIMIHTSPFIWLLKIMYVCRYRKFKGYWKFYFKFQRWQPKITSETQHSDDTHNRLRRFEPQVDHNPEQNFTVLQVNVRLLPK